MSHALVNIVAPLKLEAIAPVQALIDAMGNPSTAEVADALGRLDGDDGVHFMSLHAIPAGSGTGGHLILELSADGSQAAALRRMVDRIGSRLDPIFDHGSDRRGAPLLSYLEAHVVKIGHGWFSTPGLAFAGAPDMSVGRIRQEAALACRLADLLGEQEAGMRPIDRLRDARRQIAAEPEFAGLLDPPAAPLIAPKKGPLPGFIAVLAWSFIQTFLWPLLFVVLLPPLIVLVSMHDTAEAWGAALLALFLAFQAAVLIALVALGIAYARLRRLEKSDWVDERLPERRVLAEILQRENHHAHNHMISATVLKPGFVRMFTIRLAFWLITQVATRRFKPGYLGDIGTIHFARWVTMPGTRDFIFFSNFGGSWESYLEDFITKAHLGLTGVWSNTVGFPRTDNLLQKGATDGERFKRYARRSMAPTRFWYSAYPRLTTANIRAYAGIRRGLAAALTDEEAIDWLALFGSAIRPEEKLESSEIQSIVFGGLGFMPFGEALVVRLADDRRCAREWLASILPQVAFNDGRRLTNRDAVLTLALGPHALAKLGLPADAIETFPAAFLDGMTTGGRDRILGDTGRNAAANWWWGQQADDAVVLVYGKDDACVARLAEEVAQGCADRGHALTRRIPLRDIPAKKSERKEAFGFIDGTSQPVIRGTYRGLRNADPINLVEPGEFILGYPDNRGNVPPGPAMSPLDDPENMLPIRGDCAGFGQTIVEDAREIGRNGSFLVIRQLEQDVDRFRGYCEAEAARLQNRFGEPYEVTPEFIGAKMIGRWHDGSSLVRNPYQSVSELRRRDTPGAHAVSRAATNPRSGATAIAPPGGGSGGGEEGLGDNDFLYGTEDPEALRCPFGAHIRRANPRDSLDPGSSEQIDISNRHRVLRIGRQYQPADGEKPGLLFMCLNGDIERQFEFVQQTWLASPSFHGLAQEVDALVGDGGEGANGFTIPTRDGPVRLSPLQQFVTMRGGGYFFLPGRRLLRFLSA